jgi:phosphomannomutase
VLQAEFPRIWVSHLLQTTCVCVAALKASRHIITASHNPEQYKGYKMVHQSGRLFRADECQIFMMPFTAEYLTSNDYNKFPAVQKKSIDGASIHIYKILKKIDVKLIQSASLQVAIDSINGAAGSVFSLSFWKSYQSKG